MMKITRRTDLPAVFPSKALNFTPDSDLLQRPKSQKQPYRKPRSPAVGVRFKRRSASADKRSRPETPLLNWKLDDAGKIRDVPPKEVRSPPERRSSRKVKGSGQEEALSARKLAAVLWRLNLPEVAADDGRGARKDRLGFQYGSSHMGMPVIGHHHGGHACGFGGKEQIESPRSVSGPRNGYLHKFQPSLQVSNPAMERATKWDPICSDTVEQIYGRTDRLDEQVHNTSAMSSLQTELAQARTRIHELETERQASKKKIEHFLRKLSEERATWRSREHEKVRAIIDDVKCDLGRERKSRQRLEAQNSKLVKELADVKLMAKRYMQDYEKERKGRELIEEVCDELAKEIGEDKAEVEAMKRESMKLHEEVDEERKMLQMAEVWREERVQMKLVDAKVMLEEKYSQMNILVSELENFLSSRSSILDKEKMKRAEFLLQSASSLNIEEIKDLSYEPPNSGDIYSIFEDVNCSEAANEREIESCGEFRGDMHANYHHDQNGNVDDDSGWETVTHPEDQDSSYSPDESDQSVNNFQRDSNVSRNGTEWDTKGYGEMPITEIIEVSEPKSHVKKVSSISRLWRSSHSNSDNCRIISVDGKNGKLSSDMLSNAASISPDRCSGRDRLSTSDFVGEWSSPESGNLHLPRGMKGCIEWPRGTQKGNLKSKLIEARIESQKIQLRQVLKQKI